MNKILVNESKNPWHNLAVEELLFDAHDDNGVVLYLWQNQNTVVIGKNQNVWKECKIHLLEAEGGRLARRTSGGGAVFHDLGNLNFTFVTSKKTYDLHRQLSVIIDAMNELGINARFTGRNDIVADNGAKFSGNAFRFSKTVGMHHGTILVDVDMTKLARYLNPSQEKLNTHAVQSVRSRVCNLTEFNSELTIDMVKAAVRHAFVREYGESSPITELDLDVCKLEETEARLSSWEWRFGESPDFDVTLSKRFEWGGLELCFRMENSRISAVTAYSDAMDEAFIADLSRIMCGLPFDLELIADKTEDMFLGNAAAGDVAAWLRNIKE